MPKKKLPTKATAADMRRWLNEGARGRVVAVSRMDVSHCVFANFLKWQGHEGVCVGGATYDTDKFEDKTIPAWFRRTFWLLPEKGTITALQALEAMKKARAR